MAATVTLEEYNGAAPGTRTDKTSGTLRFKNADNATVDLNDPLVKPTSNTEYSLPKWLRLIASGEYTQISNIRFYSDGSNNLGTGRKLWIGSAASYVQPSAVTETNDPPQIDLGGSPLEVLADFFSFTSAAPLDGDWSNAGPFTPLSPNADEQEIGDFAVLVYEAETTVSAGLGTAETFTAAYDEI